MPFNPQRDGGKRNSSPGRSRISRKTIAWGMPDVFRCLRCEYWCAYLNYPSAHEAAGALGTRHSPRPLIGEAELSEQNSGVFGREIANLCQRSEFVSEVTW